VESSEPAGARAFINECVVANLRGAVSKTVSERQVVAMPYAEFALWMLGHLAGLGTGVASSSESLRTLGTIAAIVTPEVVSAVAESAVSSIGNVKRLATARLTQLLELACRLRGLRALDALPLVRPWHGSLGNSLRVLKSRLNTFKVGLCGAELLLLLLLLLFLLLLLKLSARRDGAAYDRRRPVTSRTRTVNYSLSSH
jgi:hypothetical protein